MSFWFGRRRCTYVRPTNPTWTPDEGERIEVAFAPAITAWDERPDCYQQDYSPDQWSRFQRWVRLHDDGFSLRHLLFARHRAEREARERARRGR